MKANYTTFNKKQTEILNHIVSEKQNEFAILFEKLIIYALHNKYGYGQKRLTDLINYMGELMDEAERNSDLWETIDKDVIDNLGIKYPRFNKNKGAAEK